MKFYIAKRILFVWGMLTIAGCARNSDQRLAAVQKRQTTIHERIAADEKRATDLRKEVQELEGVLACSEFVSNAKPAGLKWRG